MSKWHTKHSRRKRASIRQDTVFSCFSCCQLRVLIESGIDMPCHLHARHDGCYCLGVSMRVLVAFLILSTAVAPPPSVESGTALVFDAENYPSCTTFELDDAQAAIADPRTCIGDACTQCNHRHTHHQVDMAACKAALSAAQTSSSLVRGYALQGTTFAIMMDSSKFLCQAPGGNSGSGNQRVAWTKGFDAKRCCWQRTQSAPPCSRGF